MGQPDEPIQSLVSRPAGAGSPAGPPASPPHTLRLLTYMASDLMPVVGVLAFGWQVFPILLLYWVENIVVGVMTVLEMRRAQGPGIPGGFWATVRFNGVRLADMDRSKRSLIGLFCANYGIFTLIHGVFVVVMFGATAEGGAPQAGPAGVVAAWWFWLAVASLWLSHWLAYRREFVATGEFERVSPAQVMVRPYGRMIALHVAIVFGGWFIQSIGAPLGGLLILVAVKTACDVLQLWSRPADTGPVSSDEIWLLGDDADQPSAPGSIDVAAPPELTSPPSPLTSDRVRRGELGWLRRDI